MLEQLVGDRIHPSLEATTKREVLLELAGQVHAEYPSLATETIYQALQERETLGSTGIGDGIALPHGKLKTLDQLLISFGRSRRGVQFEAVDGKPVHLFFLLLAPQHSAREYLNTLAHLSRFLKNPSVQTRLLNAETKEELREIFRDAAWD